MNTTKLYKYTCMGAAFLFITAAILNDRLATISISTNSLLMFIIAIVLIRESDVKSE